MSAGSGKPAASAMRLVPHKEEKVLNRRPADVQLTAEQLVLEARAMEMDLETKRRPDRAITDPAELRAYQERKRLEFEQRLLGGGVRAGRYKRYARFEEEQKEFDRARTVFERGLKHLSTDPQLWLAYVAMEIRNKFMSRARNVLDRAVAVLPRVPQLWLKYAFLEEAVGNLNNARRVFERWSDWEPPEEGWLAYANFELRHGFPDRARVVYERYVAAYPSEASFLKLARWEERQGQLALARRAYERALDALTKEERSWRLFVELAKFEVRCREFERARAVFQLGIKLEEEERGEEGHAEAIRKEMLAFEKQYGSRDAVEAAVVEKRRRAYRAKCDEDRLDVDSWLDLIRLEEGQGVENAARIRATYEEAVKNIPPVAEKRFWRRYIYLWLFYACWEEAVAGDVARARAVLGAASKIVPHRKFTFGKLWIARAELEIRHGSLPTARKILGRSIGLCPKPKLFRYYVALETRLGETSRVRTLYTKWLEFAPHSTQTWIAFATLEQSLAEPERARAIYEIALTIPTLEIPKVLWKAYIDLEVSLGNLDQASSLFLRLIETSPDVRAWVAYARFQATVVRDPVQARSVFQRGYDAYKNAGAAANADRKLLRDAWEQFELNHAHSIGQETTEHLDTVRAKRPEPRVIRRPIFDEAGNQAGFEEVVDFKFPDDEDDERAKGWAALMRRARLAKQANSSSSAPTTEPPPTVGEKRPHTEERGVGEEEEEEEEEG